MRLLIPFFTLFFFSHAPVAQESKTSDFERLKTGEFYVLKGSDTCFISRTSTRQYEKCQGQDTTHELIIIWLKKNKYILRDLHYNPTNAPKVMRKDAVLTILETQQTFYTVHVRTQGQKSYQMTVYYLKHD